MNKKNKITFLTIDEKINPYQCQKMIIDKEKKSILIEYGKKFDESFSKEIETQLKNDKIARVTAFEDLYYEDVKLGIICEKALIVIARKTLRKINRELYRKISNCEGKQILIHDEHYLKKNMFSFKKTIGEQECKTILRYYREKILKGIIDLDELINIHYCLLNGSQLIRPLNTDEVNEQLVTKALTLNNRK